MELNRIRSWAEINLDNLSKNFKIIKNTTKSKIMAIIKADAYGHGFFPVAKHLIDCGVDYFGVACLDEAMAIRNSGIKTPVLILGFVDTAATALCIENDISLTIYNEESAKALSDAAVSLNKQAKIHLKIDTGMSRLGFVYNEHEEENKKTIQTLYNITKLPNLFVQGIFSHFSDADTESREFTKLQFSRFQEVCSALYALGVTIPIKHICNSAGILSYPEMHLDMVRPGIILYGLAPSPFFGDIKLFPVLSLKTQIASIKEIPAGSSVSYGRYFKTEKNTKVAVLPIGYADGFSRILSGKSCVIIGDKKCPVLGAVCMDQCVVDISDIKNASVGDEVIIIGEKNGNTILADDIAKAMGTINYEIVCQINKRIPRIYLHNGIAVCEDNFLASSHFGNNSR